MRKTIQGCRLSKDDLADLIAIIVSDLGDDPVLTLEVERGISSIQAATLDGLLSELRNPPWLDNISVRALNREDTRYTMIWLEGGGVRLRVQGDNETWVRGRFDELRHRLIDRQRRPFLPEASLPYGVMATAVYASVITSAGASGVARGVMLLVLAALVPPVLWLRRRGKSLVILQEAAPAQRPSSFEVGVAVVTVLLALAGLWLSWQAWKHPVG